jgi:chemotaxis protein histidine kinase CheA
MADSKHSTPSVTKFADHEVIVPPNRLKKAVRRGGSNDRDPLTDAEIAFEQLSAQFESWMQDECAELELARRLTHTDGYSHTTRQKLFRAAHDIRGHGATFGYPLAADVADSLCRVLEEAPDPSRVPLVYIDQCVDAVRAIVRERNNAKAEEIALALSTELRTIADELIGGDAQADGADASDAEPPATETSPPLAPV